MRTIVLKVTSYKLLTQSRSLSVVIGFNQMWRPMPVILAIKRLRQEDQCESKGLPGLFSEFKANLGYIARLCPQRSKEKEIHK